MAEEAARRKILGLPEEKKPEEPSPTAKSPRKRANFFSDLVDQIAARGVILLTEDGEPFAYDEELGRYRPNSPADGLAGQLLPGDHDTELVSE